MQGLAETVIFKRSESSLIDRSQFPITTLGLTKTCFNVFVASRFVPPCARSRFCV
jgi:hypothetical protein